MPILSAAVAALGVVQILTIVALWHVRRTYHAMLGLDDISQVEARLRQLLPGTVVWPAGPQFPGLRFRHASRPHVALRHGVILDIGSDRPRETRACRRLRRRLLALA